MPRNKSEKDPYADRPKLPPGWEWYATGSAIRYFGARTPHGSRHCTESASLERATATAWDLYNGAYVGPRMDA